MLVPEENKEKGGVMVPAGKLGDVIAEVMKPIINSIGEMLRGNAAAMEQISAAQTIQNDRLEALERQIRLQTPVTLKQVTYLNKAIKERARELLDQKNVSDPKAITKLGGHIRKAVLMRYGISNIREIPKHEYNVALTQITEWSNPLTVREISKEYKSN